MKTKRSLMKKAPMALFAVALLSSCAAPRSMPTAAELDKLANDIATRSFRDQGIVTVASIALR